MNCQSRSSIKNYQFAEWYILKLIQKNDFVVYAGLLRVTYEGLHCANQCCGSYEGLSHIPQFCCTVRRAILASALLACPLCHSVQQSTFSEPGPGALIYWRYSCIFIFSRSLLRKDRLYISRCVCVVGRHLNRFPQMNLLSKPFSTILFIKKLSWLIIFLFHKNFVFAHFFIMYANKT